MKKKNSANFQLFISKKSFCDKNSEFFGLNFELVRNKFLMDFEKTKQSMTLGWLDGLFRHININPLYRIPYKGLGALEGIPLMEPCVAL